MCARRAGSIDTMLEVTITFIVSINCAAIDYKPQTRPHIEDVITAVYDGGGHEIW